MIIFDDEFMRYLIESLPVSYIVMAYEDFQIEKQKQQFKRKVLDKITDADINRLDLQLKINNFIDLTNKKDI